MSRSRFPLKRPPKARGPAPEHSTSPAPAPAAERPAAREDPHSTPEAGSRSLESPSGPPAERNAKAGEPQQPAKGEPHINVEVSEPKSNRRSKPKKSGKPVAGEEQPDRREAKERDTLGDLEGGRKPIDEPARKSNDPADLGADVVQEEPVTRSNPKAPMRRPPPRSPGGKAGERPKSGATLADAAEKEGGVYKELTNGDVVSGLDALGALNVYATCIADQRMFEAGILRDVATGEHFVVQGGVDAKGRPEVNLEEVLFSHPEFANRNLRFVRHYHPRAVVIDRVPSVEDFGVLMRNLRLGREPRRPLSSVVDYIDPITGKRGESYFEYTPGVEKPYKIRYRDVNGKWQTREFGNPPDLPGSDYERFLDKFTGGPDDRAPDPISAEELGVGDEVGSARRKRGGRFAERPRQGVAEGARRAGAGGRRARSSRYAVPRRPSGGRSRSARAV